MLVRISLVLVALAVVVGIPFALRPAADERLAAARGADRLVIVTPHNEAIRHEFTAAFRRHYRETTGRDVALDWRIPGGTSEIARYLASEYTAAFQNYWVNKRGMAWDTEVDGGFDNRSLELPEDPAEDSPAQAARRAFLASEVGVGIDLFFGGGAYDFIQQAQAGRLADSGVIAARPEWFTDAVIPQKVSGEPFWDPNGLWIGTVVSSFGICYNTDSLERLGVGQVPAAWDALAGPALVKQVALADPTKSGSAAKAFEQIIQQKMQQRLDAAPGDEDAAVRSGWLDGLGLIQKISANARFFTDAAPKVPLDVSQGDAAIGMCIDFYGRFQSEAVRLPDGSSRLQYFTPLGGSSVGVDPIAMLRGAPHPETARAFIEFVLSPEGQKIWNFKVGTPGGPEKFALRRLPVRKDFYVPANEPYRSDPGIDPYVEARHFTYHETWTGPLFRVISFAIRVMSIDTHKEQVEAWRALTAAGFPPQAVARFGDLSVLAYDECMDRIRAVLRSPDRLQEVRLAKELADGFRRQYKEAADLARQGL
ncbi:MAG: ABC transporter substrate-binding protein [Chthoniobacterales bacterium]|jgi:iron(III) transport system substrate-binding protein